MRRTVLISGFVFGFVILLTLHATAQNKVVVIPLFGDEQQALSNPAPVEKTGQTTPSLPGDDGNLQKGVAWPNPRFTDNGDGTVKDNLTGLIWLKNANAFGERIWSSALTDCNTLNSGEHDLTDGSVEGDWHLPTVKELHSLIDFGNYSPALPTVNPFTGVQSYYYWSGTTHALYTDRAWFVGLNYGYVSSASKDGSFYYVWPVRSDN